MSLFFLLRHFWDYFWRIAASLCSPILVTAGKTYPKLSLITLLLSSCFYFFFLPFSHCPFLCIFVISAVHFFPSFPFNLLCPTLSFYIVFIFCLNLLWSLSFSLRSRFLTVLTPSSVAAVTRLWTEWRRNLCSVSNRAKRFFPTSKASRPSLEPAQPSTQRVPEVPYPGINGRGVKINTHFLLATKLSMHGALSPCFHTSSWLGA
jgi:hypothetical protein